LSPRTLNAGPPDPGISRPIPALALIASHEDTRTGLRNETLQAQALEACPERAYAGPTLCFLEEEGMRRTRMPITEVIVWLQAEQKAEARKRQKLQRRKRERLQKQPKPEGRRRAR
jgi:hypothetical protein